MVYMLGHFPLQPGRNDTCSYPFARMQITAVFMSEPLAASGSTTLPALHPWHPEPVLGIRWAAVLASLRILQSEASADSHRNRTDCR